MTHSLHPPASDFSSLGISSPILAILHRHHFKIPTPIQHQSIPAGLAGKDIIGIAQTGTGKTLAYGIPLIQRLQTASGNGLIVLPTRELALQVDEVLQQIGKPLGMSTAVLIGGESMGRQISAIRRQPRILVTTPGRLLDHLEQKTLRLDSVRILILDEADRMLDMGFAPQINRILKNVPRDRQTLLYSATMPHAIVGIATSHMRLPVRVEVAPAGTAAEKVEQEIILIDRGLKQALLEDLLQEHAGGALVFSRTKHGAKKICRDLNQRGYQAGEIHANRSLSQRKEALEGFKKGKYRILVATDIAARGIDVSNIEIVINYDLPDNLDDYVHRIGRTGRAGREGKAVSFVTPDQKREIREIEKIIRKSVKVVSRVPQKTRPPLSRPVTPSAPPAKGPTSTDWRRHEGQPSSRHRRRNPRAGRFGR
jgi:ATP-dependent RNA helicase RhlE